MKHLVFDIETIRDPSTWTPPKPSAPSILHAGLIGPEGESEPISGTIEAAPCDFFAPPHAWRPIVIGCVMFEDGPDNTLTVRKIGAIDVPKTGDPDIWERSLLERFRVAVARAYTPNLVTWNGRGHDLPVLMIRSLRHGVPQPWYYGNRDFRYRYSEACHLDLADHMADHGAARRMDLDGMSKLIGLPGKFGDIHGSNVEQAFAAGRHEEIATYCLHDAVQTAFLFLRWRMLKGELHPDDYRHVAGELLQHCEAETRMAEFVARVDRRVLLLEQAPAPAQAEPSAPEAA
jgi:3'-5' exonuclease